MPKRTKRRGAGSAPDSVQDYSNRRNRRLRGVSITIILALLLSLLVGALTSNPVPASAAQGIGVHIANSELVDTDGDGIENNADPDVDGDGIVNGEDPDIDGDGIENFDDADPIDTTDVDSNAPEKPVRPANYGGGFAWSLSMIIVAGAAVLSIAIVVFLLGKRRGN